MARIYVQVAPGSKRSDVEQRADGTYVVYVKAPAVEGKANRALISLLSDLLAIPASRITIARGERGRHKVLDVADMPDEILSSCLRTACRRLGGSVARRIH